MTVGGKHAIFNLMQALIDPGDEVIIPVPYWVTYKDVVNYAGGKCVFVDTDEDEGFQLSASMIERAHHAEDEDDHHQLAVESERRGVRAERNWSGSSQIAKDRGIWMMTDECYHRFLYDGEPYSMAAISGHEGNRDRGRVAFENLRDDRLAHRLRAGAGAGGRRDREAAKPLDVESDLDRAEGGDRSAARTAGIGRESCWPSTRSAAIT